MIGMMTITLMITTLVIVMIRGLTPLLIQAWILVRRDTLVQAKGARRQMQGGALALPEFCFFTFFIIISQFRSVFCMHKVRQSQSLFYRNITAGVGVPQADTIHCRYRPTFEQQTCFWVCTLPQSATGAHGSGLVYIDVLYYKIYKLIIACPDIYFYIMQLNIYIAPL